MDLTRFSLMLGISQNATSEAGRLQARQAAKNIASEAGMSLDEAFALLDEEDRLELASGPARAASTAADDDDDEPEPIPDVDDKDEAEPAVVHDDEDEPELFKRGHLSSSMEPADPALQLSTTGEIERVAAVKAALAADPERSDRDIARETGTSPTTVGRARAATGLQRLVRKVTRGGSSYDMTAGREPDETDAA